MGMIRGVRTLFVGLGVGGAVSAMGGQEVMEAYNNKEPLEITCEQFQNAPPARSWVKLKDCYFDISTASYFYDQKSGKIDDLYIPVYPNVTDRPEKTKISLHSTKPEWIRLFADFKKISDSKGDVTAFWKEHSKEFEITGDVVGSVEQGMTKSSSEHARVSELDKDLAPGFSVVKHDKNPSMVFGMGMLGFGAFSGLLGLIFGVRNFKR